MTTLADVLAVVAAAPGGLTSREVAMRLRQPSYAVCSRLAKLAASGLVVRAPIPGRKRQLRWKAGAL